LERAEGRVEDGLLRKPGVEKGYGGLNIIIAKAWKEL